MTDLPDPSDRLDSWKEIAAFLGRTVRTVQRWEKTEGLPVRRGGPGRRSAVVASRQELGEWWQRRGASLASEDDTELAEEPTLEPTPPAPRRRAGMWWSAVIIGLGVVGFVAWAAWPDRESAVVAGTARLGRLLSLSTSEGQSLRKIPLDSLSGAMAVSPASDRLFVTLPEAGAIAVVDIATRRVIDKIPVAEHPDVLVSSPDPDRLYVGGPSELGVVRVGARSVQRVPVGGAIRDLAVSADGRRVWIALAQAGLKVFDVAAGRLDIRPAIGCPMYFAFGPLQTRLFVAYQCGGPGGRDGHDAIEIIDEASRRSLLARSGPPRVGSDLALSPDGQFLWTDTHDACVTLTYDRAGCPPGEGAVLHALNAATLDLVATVRVPSIAFHSKPVFFPDGSRLAVGVEGIHVVNASLGHVEERLDLTRTGTLTFSPDGSRLFQADPVRSAILEFPVDPRADARSIRGLGAYWSADGTANDLAGGGHATEARDVVYAPGRLGRAFSFGAGATPIGFGTRFDVDILAWPATFGAWIKPQEIGAPMTILDRAGPVGWRWWLTAEGRIAFCLARGPGALACERGGVIGTRTIAAGTWHHIAVVRSETVIAIFVDGRADGSAPLAGFVPPRSEEYDDRRVTHLGGGPNKAALFVGLIDEVTVFRRALSVDDLAHLMRATSFAPR